MNHRNPIICLVAIAALVFSYRSTHAQVVAAVHTLSGKIADSVTKKYLDQATIHLMTTDRRILHSTITQSGGLFSFSQLELSTYLIEITATGYNTKTIVIDFTNHFKIVKETGIIYISTKTSALEKVEVVARKPIIRQEIDRIIYDLQEDPDSKASSALEMLRKVPYVSLDAEENILLKGTASFKVFINGKPSAMVEKNAKEVLRGMPASTIQRIEVITNPPAKYDAEGLGGIINIITNKKLNDGYSGSLNINEKFPAGGPGGGGSFSTQLGKFGITAFGGGSIRNTPKTNNSLNRITSGADTTALVQEGTVRSENRNGYFGTEFSAELDSLNLISGQFNLNGSRAEGNSIQNSQLSGKNRPLQGYGLENDNNGTGSGMDGSLNYQAGFKKNSSRLLTFSYRYSKYRDEQDANLIIQENQNSGIPNYSQVNHTVAFENTLQADYVQQAGKLLIEAGIKGIQRNNKSRFQYLLYNDDNGNYETDTSKSDQLDYDQHIFGAYNSYQYKIKSWELKTGVRVEQTIINADFKSGSSRANQNYFNIVPSLAVNRKFKNNTSINMGFTQRLKRPGINKLNPFIDRSNPNFESSGNPDLKPVLSNRIQLGYGLARKITLNMGLDYTFVKNIDLKVSYFNPATNITRTTYQNTGKASAIDHYISIGFPINKSWNANLNGSVTYFWLEGVAGSAFIKKETLIYNFTASSGYRFNKGWRINANISLISRSIISLQGTANGLTNSSFSVNKDIIKNRLSFAASLNNPFKKYRNNMIIIEGSDFTETSYAQNYFRSCAFNLNYNFGKGKQSVKKSKRGIKNDDLSN